MLQDLRFALRMMRRSPGFAVMAVAALAICIGANTAIFTIVNTVLFRPLSFPDQERLVHLTEGVPSWGLPVFPFSCPDYLFVAANNRSFEATATYKDQQLEISGIDRPERVMGARVTASLFRVLKVSPVAGHAFTDAEDSESKQVAVITDGFARRTFGSAQRAVGRTVAIDRKVYTVVGVMPRAFSFPLRGVRFNSEPAEIFIPISWPKEDREEFGYRYNHNVIARLKPGVTVEQARAEVAGLLKEFVTHYPPELRNLKDFRLSSGVTLFREEITGGVQKALLILLGAVGVVLLIGCADVANLMLSRMVARQREFSIRAALGAARWMLVRQTLAEGLVLSITGGLLGLLLAVWGLPLFLRLAPESLPRVEEIGLDWRVLCFIAAVTLLTPLLFCLAPIVDLARTTIANRLREGGRTGTQSKRQRYLMAGAVVMQFSLAFLLLASAGLLIRSFIRASESDPGFRSDHILSVPVSLPRTLYDKPEKAIGFYERLLQQVRTLPGVRQSGAITDLPMNYTNNNVYTAEGGRTENQTTHVLYVSGEALPLLRIPLLRGRFIDDRDGKDAQKVTVISQTLAEQNWPGQDPIGRRIKFGIAISNMPWMTVVGVVKDVKENLESTAPRALIFQPQKQANENDMKILLRASGEPAALEAAVRGEIKKIDPSLPVERAQTLDQWLGESLAPQRFRTFLLTSFAGVALFLAMLGIGGLLSYNATQRTQEFGVRMALGASRKDVWMLVLKQGLRLSAVGIAVGLIASFAATRVLSSLLYQTSEYDAVTFVGVPLLLALVGIAASCLPAWRAMQVDPMEALRAE